MYVFCDVTLLRFLSLYSIIYGCMKLTPTQQPVLVSQPGEWSDIVQLEKCIRLYLTWLTSDIMDPTIPGVLAVKVCIITVM